MSVNYTKLSSLQPFLLKAFYQWSINQNLTSQILVYIDLSSAIKIPKQYLDSGEPHIVFNISPQSVGNLEIDDKAVRFKARFKGEECFIFIPIHLVELIFLKENINIGMTFDCSDEDENSPFDQDDDDLTEQTELKWFDFADQTDLTTTFRELKQNSTEPFEKGLRLHSGSKSKLLKAIDPEDLRFTVL